MNEGSLIEFRLHGERRLGVAARPEGKKHWVVVDEAGRTTTVHPRQATFEVPGGPYTVEGITAFRAEVEPLLDPASLELAWEFLGEAEEVVDVAGMAELLFSATTPAHCYAAHSLLFDDALYFKQKGEQFEPRPAAQVEELRHQQAVARQREEEAAAFLGKLRDASHGKAVTWVESDQGRLENLERYALQGKESPTAKAARELLAALGRKEEERDAFKLLVAIGRWSKHENLALRRSGHPRGFDPEVVALAAERAAAPPVDPDAGRRLDLTAHHVCTIDDHHTREIDDGLSIERLEEGGVRLWIHVADPSRLIELEEPLDQEARLRATTLYLPTGMLPMFPMELAGGPMSLVEGELCPALSFGVVLEEDGAVRDYRIAPSLIRPARKLTYEEVDAILAAGAAEEPELAEFAQWAERRGRWRAAQGGFNLNTPEASIKVEDEAITIERLEESPARTLVAEMMILAGEVTARFGIDHGLPLPYRAQPEPRINEDELVGIDDPLLRDYALRRFMPRTQTTVEPSPHAGLGLPAYVQATSPIRRYADLLTHFQLKAHLRGEPLPFDAKILEGLIMTSGETARAAMQVERQSKRYWALEYLKRHQEERLKARLVRWLRPDTGLGLILLEDLALEMPMVFKEPPPLGERLTVTVGHVDTWSDSIKFHPAP
ncbi:ribonuclease catalytic domain-containing protein [Endothiovibrio diazotrophicus]